MKLITGLAIMSVLTTTTMHAQTADEVVNKHIAAIGGKEVIGKIKSMVTESNLSVMGSDLASTTTVLAGKGFKNSANFNGQEIIQVVTPTGGWSLNPLAGMVDPQPLPEDQVKGAQSALHFGGDLFNYQEKGSKVELAGNEQVEGVKTIKLKLTSKEGATSFFYLDPTTYYILKRETSITANGQEMTAVSTFSNYKKTESGYVIPYTTVTNQGFEMTITVNKVVFNTEIDPKIFAMPK